MQQAPLKTAPGIDLQYAGVARKILSIIIPAFNEARTIRYTLERIKQVMLLQGIEKEIIIIDDASTDQTAAVVQSFIDTNKGMAIFLFRNEVNSGKGASIHRGLTLATGHYILVQDADLEYDPAEYNTLLKPVINGNADVVYGSRFTGGHPHRILFFWHSIGNRILTFISNLVTNLNLTDMETGYKLFRTETIKAIQLKEKRFGFEPEVTAKIATLPGVRIYEVGISYYGRTYQEGKKIRFKDAVRTVYCILKYGLFTASASANTQAAVTSSPKEVSAQ